MPEYVFDEAFEHRLERTLREMGNEAVRPFDPYETTQLVVTSTRIGGVPFAQPPIPQQPAPPPLYPPPLYAPPEYQDYPEQGESRRWPLLAALALLIAALVFTGFATEFIKLPSNFGITIGSPAPGVSPTPVSPTPVATGSPGPTSTPLQTRRPRRSRRPTTTAVPTQLQVSAAPTTANPAPTDTPPVVVPTPAPPTVEPTQLLVTPTEPAAENSPAVL